MKVICLGGAGKICREAILDLVQFSTFDKITVALKSVRVSHGYDYGFLRNVAIPFAIATELIASGKVLKKDIVIPEEAFTDPSLLFKQLEKRGIFVKEHVIRMESKVEQGVYFMSLLAEERKRVIIELIDQIGKVRVNDLAKDFEVSTETIRVTWKS